MNIITAPPPRTLPIEGGHNLRDLGGYRTQDGRQLKWRTLYRAGALYGLPEQSRAALRELGIRAICDLRTPAERAQNPMEWHDGLDIHYYGGVTLKSGAQLEQTLSDGTALRDRMRARMFSIYTSLPFEQAASYRHLFALLATGNVPLLFNCAAGKDRTGLAAALLLTALGVPRATVLEDYLLSNEWAARLRVMMTSRHPRHESTFADPEALAPVLAADAAYLSLSFQAIEQNCGCLEAYLAEHLATGPAELAQIRTHLLE